MNGGRATKGVVNAGKKAVDSYIRKKKAIRNIPKIAHNPKYDPIDVAYKFMN